MPPIVALRRPIVYDTLLFYRIGYEYFFYILNRHRLFYGQTTSRRLADRKTAKFQKNITRRGSVPETTVKKGNDYPVGPLVLGFFIFVVIGSSLFQIIRTATTGGMA